MRPRIPLVAAMAIGALLAAPSAAMAVSFVDDDSGDDANSCMAWEPCKTVLRGLAATEPGGHVLVDGGLYGESVQLKDAKSLIEYDFNPDDGDTEAIVDGGAVAISVPAGETAGTIKGLTLRGTYSALMLAGPAAAVISNTFDSSNDGSTAL